MKMIVRDDWITTIYRGNWGGRRGTKPLLEFAPGWGLALEVELPSTWHEEGKLAMLRFTLIWGRFCIWLPWYRQYEDHYQCSGPHFGFSFTNMGQPDGPVLFLYYGNDDGTPKGSRVKIIYGPWAWGSCARWDKSDHTETHSYTYVLDSGEIQKRFATIRYEEMEWHRRWLPWRKIWRGISVKFDNEVGARAGSWKGGTVGCSYEMLPGESPLQCLRRMERERKFR